MSVGNTRDRSRSQKSQKKRWIVGRKRFMRKRCLRVIRFRCPREGKLEVLSLDNRGKSRAEMACVSQ